MKNRTLVFVDGRTLTLTNGSPPKFQSGEVAYWDGQTVLSIPESERVKAKLVDHNPKGRKDIPTYEDRVKLAHKLTGE